MNYGNLTNFIHFERVYMVEHKEGAGTNKSPVRTIKTFFTKDGDYLGRIDPV